MCVSVINKQIIVYYNYIIAHNYIITKLISANIVLVLVVFVLVVRGFCTPVHSFLVIVMIPDVHVYGMYMF